VEIVNGFVILFIATNHNLTWWLVHSTSIMFTLGQEHIMEEASKPQPIMFTGGAVPVLNKKGEVSMEKVHVKRYVAGKRPEWAADESESDDEDDKFAKNDDQEDDDVLTHIRLQRQYVEDEEVDDPRLKRLQQMQDDDQDDIDMEERLRRRRIHEPEVITNDDESDDDVVRRPTVAEEESSDDDEELDDEEIENRRALLRQRARMRVNEKEELLAVPTADEIQQDKEKEKEEEEDEEYTTDDESEYTDSEDDDGPRLKPVFVRKKDRLTIQEREKEEQRQEQLKIEAKKAAEERRKYTLKLVEQEARAEVEGVEKEIDVDSALMSVNSDDENDEAEYELWKLRELKRIKRDRDEREALIKEREETERISKLTPEERRAEARNNPKEVTNQKQKGKYKFLQKYYHRGAFFMEKEDKVFTRDFAEPTLDDHFDKTILPKVMQVKNFGRSGRTKYTHLVDQDTTDFDSAWSSEYQGTDKFMANRGGGMKQSMDRPTNSKRKT